MAHKNEISLHMNEDILKDGGKSLGFALQSIALPEFVEVLRNILEIRGATELKSLIDGLTIQATPTAFSEENEAQIRVLEETAIEFPFSEYLKAQGVKTQEADRQDLVKWWETMMLMAGEKGYTPPGHEGIDSVGRDLNLWQATGPLALKMQRNPSSYDYLPALLINNPDQVKSKLNKINEPEPFIEVLMGERMEDLRKSPVFLGSMSFIKNEEKMIQRTTSAAIYSVQLVLQREFRPRMVKK